ncbi:MAG: DNA-3-methyladenine glycosylase 2 family protein [Abditibacteriaceae bacterium]
MPQTFSQKQFRSICDELAKQDADLKCIIETHGYPIMGSRPNNYESLVHLILEQQVSLASAMAALNKLRDKIIDITPDNLLVLTDEELKACYFSRQKMTYARFVAQAIQDKTINLKRLEKLSDEEVRAQLTALKGIGNWTADIYLMSVLQRRDIFPIGDLAAVNALKEVKNLPKDTPQEKLLAIAAAWKPHRTAATRILWHHYLCSKARDRNLK